MKERDTLHSQENMVSIHKHEEQPAPLVRVEQLSKTYRDAHGSVRVLQHVNLQVQRGEFVTITGPSGAGKTTLLSLLGALDHPDEGEIWIDGVAVQRLRGPAAADFRRQKIGFVFQLFYLLPQMTALENVMAPLLPYRRMLDFDLRRRAEELLVRVGLADRLHHLPARLSGGEQQRVAIARALINRPPLILADEPTGNLDPKTGDEVLAVLHEFQRQGKQTLLMVTHNYELAATADKQIHLEALADKRGE